MAEPTHTNTPPAVPSDQPTQEVKQLIEQSNEVIDRVATAFPFHIFTSEVILYRRKVSIIKRNFFFSSKETSVRIEDILNVTLNQGPVLAELTIASQVFNDVVGHHTVTGMMAPEAARMQCLLDGYTLACQNNVDTDNLSVDKLRETLMELGRPV